MKRRALLLAVAAGAATRPAAAQITQPKTATPAAFMERAHELAEQAGRRGDNPYGAVIVKDGRIIGESGSLVSTKRDPTAQSELEAIRDACRRLGANRLDGAELFCNARPCPMCESGAYWAGVARIIGGRGLTDHGAPRLGRC